MEGGERMSKRSLVLLMVAVALIVGCQFVRDHMPEVQACYDHPEYGQVCAVLIDGKVYIKANVKLTPEDQSKLDAWVADKLGH